MAQSGKVKFTDFFVNIGTYIKGSCIALTTSFLSLLPIGLASLLSWGVIESNLKITGVLIIISAFILAIILSLYFWARFGFALLLYLEKGDGFFECFKNSWGATQGSSMKLVGIDCIHIIILQVLNSTFFGLLIAYPIYTSANAYAYKVLEQRRSQTEKDVSNEGI